MLNRRLLWHGKVSFYFTLVPSVSDHHAICRRFTANTETPESNGLLTADTSPSLVVPSIFRVTAQYSAAGDQPQAIQQLTEQIQQGDTFSVLRGITGTGKTFVMSHVIANIGKPCLVLCHSKTLAAQLARELRSFLSENAVELCLCRVITCTAPKHTLKKLKNI